MMLALVMLGVLVIDWAFAQSKTVSLRQLMDAPMDFIGKSIRLPAMSCVDDPKGGFVCVAQVGGRFLKIDAVVLGAMTVQSIAELLISDCKGTANLDNGQCRFE